MDRNHRWQNLSQVAGKKRLDFLAQRICQLECTADQPSRPAGVDKEATVSSCNKDLTEVEC